MTQYETYLRSLTPYIYFKFESSNTAAESSFADEVGSGTASYAGTRNDMGKKDNLFAEDDGSYSTGFMLSRYLIGTMGSASTTFSYSVMVRHDAWDQSVHVLVGGTGQSLYVTGGKICWYSSLNPPATVASATLVGPSLTPGVDYLVTVTASSGTGFGGSKHVKLFLNGTKVADSIDQGRSISNSINATIGKLFTNYSTQSTSFFGQQSVTANVDAFAQDYSYFARELTEFEVSKLGYLAKFAANPVTLSGTIIEGYSATDYRVRAHRATDGLLIHEEVTSTGSFSAVVPDLEYYVIVSAEQGEVWFPEMSAEIGTKVYPTQPSLIRFYFECTTAGITGTTEPAWNTSEYGTTSDGTAVWTVVETLIQPICHAPVRGI